MSYKNVRNSIFYMRLRILKSSLHFNFFFFQHHEILTSFQISFGCRCGKIGPLKSTEAISCTGVCHFSSELLFPLLQSVGLRCSEAGMQECPDLIAIATARLSLFSIGFGSCL